LSLVISVTASPAFQTGVPRIAGRSPSCASAKRSRVRRRFRDRLRAARNAGVGVSGPVRIAVKNRDGFACVWCVADEPSHVDHVCPKVWGGADVMDNLQTLCQPGVDVGQLRAGH
jgi:5-methylcytosine-specific restriction endonuclease McrA